MEPAQLRRSLRREDWSAALGEGVNLRGRGPTREGSGTANLQEFWLTFSLFEECGDNAERSDKTCLQGP